jgi:hypothetical protein
MTTWSASGERSTSYQKCSTPTSSSCTRYVWAQQIIETAKYFFFVMEYAQNGELSYYIEKQKRHPPV